MRLLHSFALGFYNLSSILCLRYENGIYEVSSVLACINVIKFPVLLILNGVSHYGTTMNTAVNKETEDFVMKFSKFSLISMVASAIFMINASSTIVFLQFRRRHDLQKLANSASSKIIHEKFRRQFVARCLKFSTITYSSVLILISSHFATSYHFSLPSLSILLFSLNNTMIFWNFVGLIFLNHCFIVTLLKNLEHELKNIAMLDQVSNDECYVKFARNYQDIFELNLASERSSGAQVTVMLCTTILSIVITVSNLSSDDE